MVRIGSEVDPLLRRPFSLLGMIHEQDRVTGIEILFKVVGKGTERLSRCKTGDRLSVIGPLGNAFLVPETCRRLILVAGGLGVPPIRFLAHRLLAQEGSLSRCMVFVGGRSKDDLVCLTEFDLPGFLLDISTDDGSQGNPGVVTRSLKKGPGRRTGGSDLRLRAARDAQSGRRNRHSARHRLPGVHRGYDGLRDGRLPGLRGCGSGRRCPVSARLYGRSGVRCPPAEVVTASQIDGILTLT